MVMAVKRRRAARRHPAVARCQRAAPGRSASSALLVIIVWCAGADCDSGADGPGGHEHCRTGAASHPLAIIRLIRHFIPRSGRM